MAPVEYNYRSLADWRAAGSDLVADGERPSSPASAASCAMATQVFHTYSTFARGTDNIGSAYDFLDLTALGRQEEWEEPKGRVGNAWGAIPTFAS